MLTVGFVFFLVIRLVRRVHFRELTHSEVAAQVVEIHPTVTFSEDIPRVPAVTLKLKEAMVKKSIFWICSESLLVSWAIDSVSSYSFGRPLTFL